MATASPALRATSPQAGRRIRPSFFGAVRGEALKLSRQLSFWLTLVGGAVLLAVIVLAISGATNLKESLLADSTAWAYNMLNVFGTVFQIGSAIVLLIFGARLIGMEYSSGTIRIAYARGAGRLRLLLAKLFTLAAVGVALLAGYLIVIAASLAFYPADNFLNILEILAIRATGHDQPWIGISQYQLGPNLNVVLNLIEPSHHSRPAFASPLAAVDATHALLVIGAFALVFAAVAVLRTVRPDVLE